MSVDWGRVDAFTLHWLLATDPSFHTSSGLFGESPQDSQPLQKIAFINKATHVCLFEPIRVYW